MGGRQGLHTCKHLLHSQTHGSRGTSPAIQSNQDVHVCDSKYGLSGYVYIVVMMVHVSGNEGVEEKW
jgi:hypothetical protein